MEEDKDKEFVRQIVAQMEYDNLNSIIEQVSDKWASLGLASKKALATAIAGKRK